MNEISVFKSVITDVWLCSLLKKMMTEMSHAISWNTVTSFLKTNFFCFATILFRLILPERIVNSLYFQSYYFS